MTLLNKVDQFVTDTDIIHQVANGDENTVVQTAGGPVRSVAKLIKDNQAALSGLGGLQNNLAGPHGAEMIGLSDGSNVATSLSYLNSSKEGAISPGTTAQFYRGDKTWQSISASVQGTVLANYVPITGGTVNPNDSVVNAIGKLQYQITNIGAAVRSSTLAGLTVAASNTLVNGADTVLSGFGKLALLQQIVGTKGLPYGVVGLDSTARIMIPPPSGNGAPAYFYQNNTTNRVYNLQDKSGTLAMLDDISSGPMVLLGSSTLSAANIAILFLMAFTADYDKYIIEYEHVAASTTTATLMLQFAKAGGSDQTAGNYYSVAGGSGNMTSGSYIALATAFLNAAGTIEITNCNSTAATDFKSVAVRGASYNGTNYQGVALEGVYRPAAAVSGFMLTVSTGNLISGTVRVYGVKNN